MSRDDVAIVLAKFEAVNRRDWAAVMAAYDEDVVLLVDASMSPDAGVWSGRDAVGEWFGDWFRSFGRDYRFEIEEADSVGDRVLVVARHHGQGRTSGVEVERTTTNVYTLRGAKITRLELYRSRVEALEAMGPRE